MGELKLISWNVNGIRASVKKGFYDIIKKFDADVFLVQETKATVEIVTGIGGELKNYRTLSNEAEKKGYSGTAVMTKLPVLRELYAIDIPDHDREGRITGLEFEKFYLINVYVPNSGSELVRLDYRKTWDRDFLSFLKKLEARKPVIIGGDFNVAHERIDLARPDANYNKTSGFTQTEIDGFDNFMNAGFIDSFRSLHPDKIAYSFWSQRFGARAKNVGWRIDYFLLSAGLKGVIRKAEIFPDVMGSDHCPIGLEIEL